MDVGRTNDVSPEAMQARIQQARREAENLKDRIRLKKEGLADTTREFACLELFSRPSLLNGYRNSPS